MTIESGPYTILLNYLFAYDNTTVHDALHRVTIDITTMSIPHFFIIEVLLEVYAARVWFEE